MKFALAFTALASAADNQSPVISLDLSTTKTISREFPGCENSPAAGHWSCASDTEPRSHDFDDECEVSQNGADCELPIASVTDAHDDKHEENIEVQTHYRLFVKCGAQAESVVHPSKDTEWFETLDHLKATRGEWLITYDAEDSNGNQATTIKFALILVDTEKPQCGTGTEDVSSKRCTRFQNGHTDDAFDSGLKYHTSDVDDSIDIIINLAEAVVSLEEGMFTWAPVAYTEVYDRYDGLLTDQRKEFSYSDGSNIENGRIMHQDIFKNRNLDNNAISTYTYTSKDYANIFGTNNQDNVRTETGTISFVYNDFPSKITFPSFGPSFGDTFECGKYIDVSSDSDDKKISSVDLTYVDIYDDFNGNDKNVIQIAVTKPAVSSVVVSPAIENENLELGSTGYGLLEKYFGTKTDSLVFNYTATNKFGHSISEEKKFIVSDTIEPVLYISIVNNETTHCSDADSSCVHGHLVEPSSADVTIQHSAGGTSNESSWFNSLLENNVGYRCYDQCDGQLTADVSWSGENCGESGDVQFQMDKVGTYYLKYSCSDESSRVSTACRTIINEDITIPIITMIHPEENDAGYVYHNNGDYYMEASLETSYVDLGAACSDIVDGVINEKVEVSGDVVDMELPDTYTITYNCQDNSDISAEPLEREVVVRDTTPPTCSWSTDFNLDLVHEAEDTYNRVYPNCTDSLMVANFDDDEKNVEINYESSDESSEGTEIVTDVDPSRLGKYSITFSVTDQASNSASISRTVTVEDRVSPVISLSYFSNPNSLMAESTSSVNGWVIGAVASSVSGVALLGYAVSRKSTVATSVPV